MVIAPLLLYPFSKTIWLALDLTARPPRPQDFEGHHQGLSRPR
jgi:hypothetical protein